MDGLGKKSLEYENGYMSATGNHRHLTAGRAFENNVQHHFVVPRVLMMLMMYPASNSAMDFHVAVERDMAYLEDDVTDIRSSV